jgi:hypothetical protein
MTKRLLDIGARMRGALVPMVVHADVELFPLWQAGEAEGLARVLTGRIVADFMRWTAPAFKQLSALYLREPGTTDGPVMLREITELMHELNGAEAYASVALCWSHLVSEAMDGRAPADAHPLWFAIVGLHRFVEAAWEAGLLRAPEAIERLERILPLLAQIVDERVRASPRTSRAAAIRPRAPCGPCATGSSSRTSTRDRSSAASTGTET